MRPGKRPGEPVFIFVPVRDRAASGAQVVVDPVCGRALQRGTAAGRLLHAGKHHEFCSLECARAFAADPEGYHQHER